MYNDLAPRAVGISTGPDSHLDHLGVLCAILDIPLVVTEHKKFQLAQKFYPQCQTHFIDLEDLSLEYLAKQFDVIFECGKFWSLELLPLFELLFQKKMRIVFCPHGNSDKGHSLVNSSQHVPQDIALVYGKQMIDYLTNSGAIQQIGRIVRTGNYRYAFYRKNREFYDALAEEEIFKKFDKTKKTLLYAPTWSDKENPTSFFAFCSKIIDQLSSRFNVLIKLHPLLEEYHPAETYAVLGRYEYSKGIFFLTKFPPIFPLLNFCDFYLGDFSSVGYDFLAFNKPLYFINPLPELIKNEEGRFLHRCGLEIPSDAWNCLDDFFFDTLETNQQDFSPLRRKIYRYAFGKEVESERLKKKIFC